MEILHNKYLQFTHFFSFLNKYSKKNRINEEETMGAVSEVEKRVSVRSTAKD